MSVQGVLILYNLPGTLPAQQAGVGAEADEGVLAEVAAVKDALTGAGIPVRTAGVRTLKDAAGELARADERCIFNLVESLAGAWCDFTFVPALCRSVGKACTGSGAAAQLLCLDKAVAKAMLASRGLPVPDGVVVPVGGAAARLPAFPVIVKPLMADASEGIDADSIIFNADPAAVAARVAHVHETFRQPALVESFIEGRELNISVLEREDGMDVLPVAEIEFDGFGADRPRIVGYAAKWRNDSYEYLHTLRRLPADLPADVAARLSALAREAAQAVGVGGYARVDFRLGGDGRAYILEVNPNPDISPDAGFAAALEAAGIPFDRFVKTAVLTACREAGVTPPDFERRTPVAIPSKTLTELVRATVVHRDPVVAMVERTGFFMPNEVETAAEVLDAALRDGPDGHYQSYVAVLNREAVGWVCFGPTPCTDGTWDIYWLVVDPSRQGHGIGRRLMMFAENAIVQRSGRLAVAETAGRALYAPTRAFYEACGYQRATAVTDFYALGDDKVIYTKRLGPATGVTR